MNKFWIGILIFGLGLIAGLYISKDTKCDSTTSFEYINKELDCNEKPVVKKAEYVVLSKKIGDYLDSKKQDGSISRLAVYFRDLKAGPTASVNGDEKFAPASLLKIPVAITYFRVEEERKDKGLDSVLDKHIAYKGRGTDGASQFYKPKETLKPETPYSIRDLIFRMLAYSDNDAYQGLRDYLKKLYPEKDYVLETFGDLGILDPQNGLDQTLSARALASNFRLLYNASYLSKEHSEELLQMLGKSDFAAGLRAGVPEEIAIAHKFGERQLDQNNWEIHDCGIVYYSSNPYSICVMAQGKAPIKLSQVIAEISKMFYLEFNSRKL